MSTEKEAIEAVKAKSNLGKGAQFWVYISPMNDTENVLTEWSVTFSQGNWKKQITSKNPQEILKTDGMSGLFDLHVEAAGHKFPLQQIHPGKGDTENIGCNSNCSSMVKIIANENGDGAYYSPTWDAFCS